MDKKRVYNEEIERISKESSERHISRILRAIEKDKKDLVSVFDILKTNRKISNLVDEDYFPRTLEKLDNRHFEYDPSYDMSIYYLLKWGSNLIQYYGEKINKYLCLKAKYENALFGESYDEASSVIEDILQEFGISEWIYSQKFVLGSLTGNNDGKNEILYLKDVLVSNDLLKMTLAYYEKMANSNINYEDYCQSVDKILEREDGKSIRGRYLNYKLNINTNGSIHEFKSALIIDEQISLIDYYETFINILQNLFNTTKKTPFIKEIVNKLQFIVNDFRMRNLYIALGGTVKSSQIDEYINRIIEKYTTANYTELINEYNNSLIYRRVDFDLYNIFLKSNIDIGEMKAPHKNLWKEVFAIYNLKYKYVDSVNRIGNYYKLFYNTSWRYKLCGILSRKLSYIENDRILSLCVVNDQYLTPLFFQVIINDKDRIAYLDAFDYLAHNTICLHKYVLTGKNNVDVENNVDPIRVKYYTIKRKMREKSYIECIDLCKSFLCDILLDTNKMYYQERIRRTLFLNYISEKLWVEAMHLYVESYLIVEELVIRMPLETLVETILNDSEYDIGIRYDICKSIILRLYYKEDDKEIISAYMDYLEGQECATIVEYIDKKYELNECEIFFLYNVCTESLLVRDYVSTSLIKGSAIDLRIYILRNLLEKDKKNAKKYFEELNFLLKEVQLQDRRKAFNHNRIFIDKIKLINYLSNTINKEFSEYSKVQEIKNIYNEFDDRTQGINLGFESIYQFFYDIIEKIKQAYLFDSPYSLEDFLSTRIRHVFCKDSLKKVFEEQTLFAKKLKDLSDEYVINEYWHDKLSKDDYSKVIKVLSEFSKKIDLKIQEIRDTWIRIKIEKNGEGMFDYCDFTRVFLECAELDFTKVLDSETEFYRSVIKELDKWTNNILKCVRNRINKELKPYYRNALLELETGIRNVKIAYECKNELLRKIEITKAKYTEDIGNFEDVFYMKSEQYPNFTIQDVIEFCCEIEKDINPRFNLVHLEIENGCDNVYNGSIFPYLVDIISILIHNAVEHSQLQDIGLLHIKVSILSTDERKKSEWYSDERLKDFSIILNFKNNLAADVDEQALNKKVMNIIGSMEANTFRQKSKLIKGSGLYKIARTLYYNLDGMGAFYFKKEEGWFNLSIAMNLKKYIEKK